MKIGPVIERLRAQVAAFSDRVYGAGDVAEALENDDTAVPAAYVIPLADDAGENATAGGVVQAVEEQIAVLVMVDASGDDRGQAAAEALDDHKIAIMAALLGFEPAAEYTGFVYRGGNVVAVTRARLTWQFDYGAMVAVQQV